MKACPAMMTSVVRSVCNPVHRSQPVFQPAVISLDRIVGVLLDMVPRRRDELVEHAG
jgi:hypothetical protein